MKSYLLIEDDSDVASIVETSLRCEEFQGERAADGYSALRLLKLNRYDIIILDLMIPGPSGFQILKEMQELNISTPVMVLSGLNRVEDRVTGLNLGADDYLCKPFSMTELQMRINNLLARDRSKKEVALIGFGDLVLNRLKRTVAYRGSVLDLTSREFRLLEILVSNPNKILSKAQILRDIFDYTFTPATNVVDVMICRLRTKLEMTKDDIEICTIRGAGYVFRAMVRQKEDFKAQNKNMTVSENSHYFV